MPWIPIAATALAGSAIGSGISSIFQANAANSAAARARRATYQGLDELAQGFNTARPALQGGFNLGVQRLQQGQEMLGAGRQELRDIFAQERATGAQALQRLQDVVLGGNTQALQLDPGYQFRVDEANKALLRSQAASGEIGGGAAYRQTARYNQDLASQEFQNAYNRLLGLQQIGSEANARYAGLSQGAIAQQASNLAQQADLARQSGLAGADLASQYYGNRASLRLNSAGIQNQLGFQRANAIAQGIGGVTNAGQNFAELYLLGNLLQQPGGGGGLRQ